MDVITINRSYQIGPQRFGFCVAEIARVDATAPPVTRGGRPEVRIVINRRINANAWSTKLDQMKKLESGWNGYDAPAPSPAAIETARGFLTHLLNEQFEP